jgi:hypothetical protein
MKGHCGLRFQNIPQGTQELIERWLDERMEQEHPGSKERVAGGEAEMPQDS